MEKAVLGSNNLFKYATGELSHDAFIIWLLSFARPEHEHEVPALADCARRMIGHMMTKAGLSLQTGEPETLVVVKAVRQYHNIDVYLQVQRASGEILHVIIENKLYTKEHGNQMQRYLSKLAEIEKTDVASLPAILVYYKIIEEKERTGERIAHVDRGQVLGILEPYVEPCGGHAIVRDYVEYLQDLDRSAEQFRHAPIAAWDYHAYLGFFAWLCNQQAPHVNTRHGYGWDYVPNPSGGFLGMYWWFIGGERLRASGLESYADLLFLVIEKDKITVKLEIHSPDKDRSRIADVRWKLYRYFKSLDERFEKRAFKPGKSMTVGYLSYDEKDYLAKIKQMEAAMQSIADGAFQI